MIFTVVGILFVSALCVAGELVFRVDIDIPQREGRKEINDVKFIERTISEATGLQVVIAKKAFDNQKFILVVEVSEIRSWSSLTSTLSEKGYSLSVTSLQSCSDYAMELGVDVTYPGMDKVQDTDVIDLFDVVFRDEGLTSDEYMAIVKKHFEKDQLVVRLSVICYRSYGELPVKLLYLDHFAPEKLEKVYQEVLVEGRASIKLSKFYSLDDYANEK